MLVRCILLLRDSSLFPCRDLVLHFFYFLIHVIDTLTISQWSVRKDDVYSFLFRGLHHSVLEKHVQQIVVIFNFSFHWYWDFLADIFTDKIRTSRAKRKQARNDRSSNKQLERGKFHWKFECSVHHHTTNLISLLVTSQHLSEMTMSTCFCSFSFGETRTTDSSKLDKAPQNPNTSTCLSGLMFLRRVLIASEFPSSNFRSRSEALGLYIC